MKKTLLIITTSIFFVTLSQSSLAFNQDIWKQIKNSSLESNSTKKIKHYGRHHNQHHGYNNDHYYQPKYVMGHGRHGHYWK